MSEFVQANYRVLPEHRDWLNGRPEGASEALRAILDDVMRNGTGTKVLLEERRVSIAGDSITFEEFVRLHILVRSGAHRESYMRSPAVADYLRSFGRTYTEMQTEVSRLEAPQ